MNAIKKFFDIYIEGYFHIAISVWCLTNITGIYFNINTVLLSVFSALLALAAYNYIQLVGHSKKPFRLPITLIAISILVILSIKLQFKALLTLVPVFGITLFYVTPTFFSFKKKYALRNTPGLKLYCIAMAWTLTIIGLPVLQNNIIINNNVWLFSLQFFLFIITLTLPFDIRDLNKDPKNLKTIPQCIGIINTKILGSIYITSILIIEFIKNETLVILNTPLFYISIILGILLWNSTPKRKFSYFSFWIEGLPILWFLLHLITDIEQL